MSGSAAPPPHVSLILDGNARVEGLTAPLRRQLAERGCKLRREWFGYECVRFDTEPADVTQNRSLIDALQTLASLGVAFLHDPRQGWSPEDVALLLRERDLLQGPLSGCGFDGTLWQKWEL